MGKSNRIRVNRANEKVQTIGVKQKKEMPSWVISLIAIVLTVAILAGIAVSLMSANGVFNRMTKTVSSKHYTVNANMLAYYFSLQYENFYSTYGSYFSDMPSKGELKTSNYSEATDTAEAVTWFDYFMNQTVESVKSMLVYCEEARAQGWDKLTDEEKDTIDANIDTLKEQALASGYTANSYVAAMYGEGVKISDIRKAMKYSTIATKCMNNLTESMNEAITEEMINARYNEKKNEFDVIDYTYYTFNVKYEDVAKEVLGKDSYTADEEAAQKDAILTAYKEKIAEAKEKANTLSANATDADTFKRLVLGYVAQESFESVYDTKTVADEDKPSEDNLNTIKAALIAAAVNEVMEGRTATDDAATKGEGEGAKGSAYGVEITNTYADTLNSVKTEVFDEVLAAVDTYVTDKGQYVADDKFSEWAFSDGRAAGDKKVITVGAGEDETKDITADTKTSATSVYFIRTPQRPDEEKTRSVAYMLFDSEENAKAAIAALAGTPDMTLDQFEAYAEGDETVTAHTHLENYVKGNIGNEVFDNWVYGETATVGKINDAPLELETGVYAVIYYYAEGDAMWNVEVRTAILTENYETKYAEMEGVYAIEVKEKALDKVDA